jgi:cell wall-associated NlpC family hydrolase
MDTIAWTAVLVGMLLIRQVAKGRVKNTPSDFKDMFVGLATGNFADVRTAFNQTGESGLVLTPSELTAETAGVGDATGGGSGTIAGAVLLAEVQKLGKASTGKYLWGAVGPARYDCSGLVWRAMKNMGYKGGRFTTFTFPPIGKKYGIEVKTPKPGDIAVWNKGAHGHMGVVSGPNQMYAARSTATGIGFQSLSGPTSELGTSPHFYRLNNVS